MHLALTACSLAHYSGYNAHGSLTLHPSLSYLLTASPQERYNENKQREMEAQHEFLMREAQMKHETKMMEMRLEMLELEATYLREQAEEDRERSEREEENFRREREANLIFLEEREKRTRWRRPRWSRGGGQ